MKGPAAAKTTTSPAAAPAGAGAAPPGSPAGKQNTQANAGAKAKKPDPQKVQQIKTQHANFRAQPKPQQVPAVTYNQNYRIQKANSGRVSNTKYSARIIRNGTIRAGIIRITTAWS